MMMTKRCKILFQTILFICFFLPLFSYADEPTYHQIIFFGDSLTDNGNLYASDFGYLPKDPPYFKGRFSNGYVWSDYLAKGLDEKERIIATNFAVGGETAIWHDPISGFLPYTLKMSLESYLTRNLTQDKATTLYIFWIGANDYLRAPQNIDELSTNVIASIQTSIEHLIYHGARNFLLLNIPDMAKTPYGKMSGESEMLSLATVLHNTKLDALATTLKESNKGINIHVFDANFFFNKLISDPDGYNKKHNTHITKTMEACWGGGYTLAKVKPLNEAHILEKLTEYLRKYAYQTNVITKNFNAQAFAHQIVKNPALAEAYRVMSAKEGGVEPCADADAYVFWDKLHPTALMHSIMSTRITKFIKENYTQSAL